MNKKITLTLLQSFWDWMLINKYATIDKFGDINILNLNVRDMDKRLLVGYLMNYIIEKKQINNLHINFENNNMASIINELMYIAFNLE